MRLWWIVALSVGCATAPPPPPEPAPPVEEPAVAEPEPVVEEPFSCPEERGLCFQVEPAHAELVINGEVRGKLDEIGRDGQLFLALEAGIYQVTLGADGFETWRAEVSVQEGLETIEVSLTPTE